ncbi:MAG: hypothetical protein RhofKO_40650 [Rhodothermales bacterium]
MRKLTGILCLTLGLLSFGCQDAIVDPVVPEVDEDTVVEVVPEEVAPVADTPNDLPPVQATFDATTNTVTIDSMIESDAVYAAVWAKANLSISGDKIYIGANRPDGLLGYVKLEPGETEDINIPLNTAVPGDAANLLVSLHRDSHEADVFEHAVATSDEDDLQGWGRDVPVPHEYALTNSQTGEVTPTVLPLHTYIIF